METMPTTVFVVEDHALVRSGLVRIIGVEEDLEVVGEGDGTLATLDEVRRCRPDVVVVDLEMPKMRGADFIDRLKQEGVSSRALVCTMHASHGYVAEALRRGADGYVLKSSPSSLLIEAVRSVARGEGFIDPALQTDVIQLLHKDDVTAQDLTARETEALRLAAEGLSNQEISRRTRQSVETVKLRLRRCFHKLGATDRASAVAAAVRRGLI